MVVEDLLVRFRVRAGVVALGTVGAHPLGLPVCGLLVLASGFVGGGDRVDDRRAWVSGAGDALDSGGCVEWNGLFGRGFGFGHGGAHLLGGVPFPMRGRRPRHGFGHRA